MELAQDCVLWWAVLNICVLLSRLSEIVLLFMFVEFYIRYKYYLHDLLIKLSCIYRIFSNLIHTLFTVLEG
jgi:hypothetical protein